MRKQNENGGYLLVEILVAMFVIVILVTVGALILNVSNGARSRAENLGEANAIAFAKIQEYELKDFASIPNGSPGSNYEIEDFAAEITSRPENKFKNVEAKVYSEGISGSLKRLWLTLTYDFGTGGFTIEYATYIQIDGVGR